MNQHSDPGFEPRVADWLEDGPVQAPRDVMTTVRAALPSVKQRRALAPWRHPVMSQLTKLAAAAAIVVAVGAGAYLLGSNAPNATPGPAGANEMAAYREARDAICVAAQEQLEPYKARLGTIYDAEATDAQRADGIEALRALARAYPAVIDDLDALVAPPEIAEDDIAAVTRYRDLYLLIQQVLIRLDAGDLVGAEAVDLATNAIGQPIEAFERTHRLESCP
jgi:hypothetical protein